MINQKRWVVFSARKQMYSPCRERANEKIHFYWSCAFVWNKANEVSSCRTENQCACSSFAPGLSQQDTLHGVSTYHGRGANSEGRNAGRRGGEAERDRDGSYSRLHKTKATQKAWRPVHSFFPTQCCAAVLDHRNTIWFGTNGALRSRRLSWNKL